MIELQLELEDVIDIIEISKNKAYTVAILSGGFSKAEYLSKFPKIGTILVTKENEFSAKVTNEVTGVDPKEDEITLKYKQVRYYKSEKDIEDKGADYRTTANKEYNLPVESGAYSSFRMSLSRWTDNAAIGELIEPKEIATKG